MREIVKFSISDLFKSLREHGLDPDHALLWGYFFLDRDPHKLMDLARKLARDGYHLSALTREPGGQRYRLYLEKIESHTPRSLDLRNQELQQLADSLRLDAYDGSDVGPLPEDDLPTADPQTSALVAKGSSEEESAQPTPEESAQPTPEESAQPMPEESAQPMPEESAQPTPEESAQPTPDEKKDPSSRTGEREP